MVLRHVVRKRIIGKQTANFGSASSKMAAAGMKGINKRLGDRSLGPVVDCVQMLCQPQDSNGIPPQLFEICPSTSPHRLIQISWEFRSCGSSCRDLYRDLDFGLATPAVPARGVEQSSAFDESDWTSGLSISLNRG